MEEQQAIDLNRERLATTFIQLCEIDSPSRQEGKLAARLREIFTGFSPDESFEDDSGARTGSESGNLFFRFRGDQNKKPIFLNCHMDTVQPGIGVKVQRHGDIFTSEGATILGSDDKSGIAAIIEALQVLQEQQLSCRPLEIIFTTCEEIGLLGAKAINPDHIQAPMGYALDSTGFGRIIIGAPASNRLHISVNGVGAHAGLHPEHGVSAIVLAAQALAKAPCGRIDAHSTVNFGTIKGGTASNIVPEQVVIEGEVRSHDQKRLDELTHRISESFLNTVNTWQDPSGAARGKPTVDIAIQLDFPLLQLEPTDAVILEIERAARSVNMELTFEVAGGGSDANILNGLGLQTAIISTGMTHVHSTDEQVNLRDMENLTRLLLALIT